MSATDQAKAFMFFNNTSFKAPSKASLTDAPNLNFLPFRSIFFTSPTDFGRPSRRLVLGSSSKFELFYEVIMVYDPL